MRTYNTKGSVRIAWLAGGILAAVALVGIHAAYPSLRPYTVVYSGRVVDDYKVDYAEGEGYSKLTALKDGVTIELQDEEGSTPLGWNLDKKPVFERDTLEKVVVTDAKKKCKYHVSDISDTTLDGKHTKQVFAQANVLYHSLRTKIREGVRNDYLTDAKRVEELLQ